MVTSLKDVMAGLERTAEEFCDAVVATPGEVWNRKPPGDGWSLAELAEHIALVERSTGKLIVRKLTEAQASPDLLLLTVGQEERLRLVQANRTARISAPDFVRPTGRWPLKEDVLAAFGESREATLAFVRDFPGDLRLYAAQHPVLGPLDGVQWLVMLVAHLDRHLEQWREMRAQ